MRPRVSIRRMLALIVAFGIALAALRSPSNLGANALLTLTLAALVVSVINFVYSRARVRAFWVGFLIAGSAYFLLHWVTPLGDRLVSVPLLDILYPHLVPPEPTQPVARASAGRTYAILVSRGAFGGPPPPDHGRWAVWTEPDRTSGLGAAVGSVMLSSPEPYRLIGHSLITLVVAALGGLYARHRYDGCCATRPRGDPAMSFSFDTSRAD